MSQVQLQTSYSGRLDIERMFNAAQNISFDGHNSGKNAKKMTLSTANKCIPQIMFKSQDWSNVPQFLMAKYGRVSFFSETVLFLKLLVSVTTQ